MMSSFKIWAIDNQSLLTSVAAVSVFIFFLSLLSLPWVVSKIPKDYFIRNANRFDFWREKFPSSWLIIIIIKNVVGFFLLIGGLIMLVLPGQGIITVIISLILLDYPGKSHLERKFALNKKVFPKLNWLREKAKTEPLISPNQSKN